MSSVNKIVGLEAVDYKLLKFNNGATMSYGKRIGFVDPGNKGLLRTNPRGEFGKFGIANHGYLESFFYSVIPVEVKVAGSEQTEVFYLNKRSTVKWLNSQLVDLNYDDNTKDKKIIKTINALSKCLKKQNLKQEKILQKQDKKTYTASLSNRRLVSLLDTIQAIFWKSFASICNLSWGLLKIRFSLQLREKTIDTASKILAADICRKTYATVPAYKKFINENVKRKNVTTFDQIPATTKDNYIKPALKDKNEVSLYVNGEIPFKSKRDTSTGTSGPSTPWYRGPLEQRHVERMTTYAAKAILGDRPYTFINGFAMGPWATGVTATLAMTNNSQSGVSVIGPNIDEIYNCIKEQARIFGKDHPIVVSGYPPHLRAVIEKAVEENFPLHEYHVIGVVGGEAMSEDLRDLLVVQKDEKNKIIRTGLKQCYSSYGASDLDINIGYESDFEIELRKICHKPEYAALAEELFGKNEFKPMIFHYDPLNYLIESDEYRNLYYTCVRQDRISPRVRYDLGDIGKTMPVSELLATLKKHGITLKNLPNTSLPLLFIWGRQGSHISFRGCKIAPENLGEMIRRLDSLELPGLNAKIAHYGFYQHEEKGRTVTEILIEFNDENDFNEADPELLKHLLEKLAVVNTDYVAHINCPLNEKPMLRVFKKGESPMDVQQKKYSMRKKQYIFKEGDEFIPSHEDDMSTKGKLIVLEK